MFASLRKYGALLALLVAALVLSIRAAVPAAGPASRPSPASGQAVASASTPWAATEPTASEPTAPEPAATEPAAAEPTAPIVYTLGNARPGEVVHSVSADDKLIALTFDDGPGQYLETIIAALEKAGARATFFEVGDRSKGHDGKLDLIVSSGNELANHTYTHEDLEPSVGAEEISVALDKTQQRFESATGVRPVLFRPPSGRYDQRVVKVAGEQGLAVILWNVHSGDTSGDTASEITHNVLGNAQPGAIVLMHETAPATVEALPAILSGLKRRGYSMVTVSELLAAGQPR